MYARIDKPEFLSYVENFTDKFLREHQGQFSNLQTTIELLPLRSSNYLRQELRRALADLPKEHRFVDEKCGRDFRGYEDEYVELPEISEDIDWSKNDAFELLRERRELRGKLLADKGLDVNAYKHALRNVIIHERWCSEDTGNGFIIKTTCRQTDSPYEMLVEIKSENDMLSATVKQVLHEDRRDVSKHVVVYTVQPLKLTKFLRKIGCSERYVTLAATRITNKPKRFALQFTDQYIPEAYIWFNGRASSCMSHEADYYDLPYDEHPTLVYDNSPDVVLALVKDLDTPDNDDFPFVARAIVRVEEDCIGYCISYGLEILRSLSPFGLEEDICMEGIRLHLIESANGGYLAPYVDGTDCQFEMRGDYLVVSPYGEYTSNYATGRLNTMICCDNCNGEYPEEDMQSVNEDNAMVCCHCFENYMWCDESCTHWHADEMRRLTNGSWVHEDCAVYSEYYDGYILDREAVHSDRCDGYIHESDDEFDLIPFGDHPDDDIEEEEECY